MTPTDSTTSALDPPAPPAAAAVVDPLAEPTFEECQLEWIRYHADRAVGRLSVEGIPEGHHVAYFGGRIVDHGADDMALSARAAATAGVHWARLVIDYP
jgi:hypothetical protein